MRTFDGKFSGGFGAKRAVFMIPFLLISVMFSGNLRSESHSPENDAFERKITEIAVGYETLPFRLGANPETDGAADNSHLIHAICQKAARSIGMVFSDYMPMKKLLENTYEINAGNLRNGDLILLDNGLAALVYKVDAAGNFHCIYASEKRQKIMLIRNTDAAFKQYWLKHKKGYFRFNDNMFEPVDR